MLARACRPRDAHPVPATVIGEQRGCEPLEHSGARPSEASRGSHGGEGRHARGGGAAEAALRLVVLKVAQLAFDTWKFGRWLGWGEAVVAAVVEMISHGLSVFTPRGIQVYRNRDPPCKMELRAPRIQRGPPECSP